MRAAEHRKIGQIQPKISYYVKNFICASQISLKYKAYSLPAAWTDLDFS